MSGPKGLTVDGPCGGKYFAADEHGRVLFDGATKTTADRLLACWNACEGMGDPVVEIESLRLTDRKANSTRCNSGHDSLPVLLWDCPVCVEHKRNELLDALVMAHTRLTECGDAGVESPLTLTEIEALLRKHGRQV